MYKTAIKFIEYIQVGLYIPSTVIQVDALISQQLKVLSGGNQESQRIVKPTMWIPVA